jgi:hypothetical protein
MTDRPGMYDEEIELMVGFSPFGFPGVGAKHHKAAHNRNAKVQLPCGFLATYRTWSFYRTALSWPSSAVCSLPSEIEILPV